jgi:alpha-N-arabinofuranosidase
MDEGLLVRSFAMRFDKPTPSRRALLQTAGAALGLAAIPAVAVAEGENAPLLTVDPEPRWELSPFLYMQFMEPLGTTDGSVEASWDHLQARWRPDLVEVTRELAPPMLRWGGLFSGYYRWREGVGPRDRRLVMHNLAWGGIESNQVGTAEFTDFARQVGAEPLMCVNFESEGDPSWAKNALREVRLGDAREAADWVAYCNLPDHPQRREQGHPDPHPIRYWQLGNETSFSPQRFVRDAAIAKTIEFATAMRKVEPNVRLIGWGDSGWAPAMLERAGEHLDYLAFHHLFDPGAPLRDGEYEKDPDATWEALMGSVKRQERKLLEMRPQVEKSGKPLAMTESHFTMQGRNRCDLNSAWAVGVAYARFQNLHQRHGDVLGIANLGDFCGTRWQSNVVMLPTPRGKAYLMPLGKVAALYRKHTGAHFVRCAGGSPDLDITASRTGDRFFFHVVNTHRTRSQSLRLEITGQAVKRARAWEIAADPFFELTAALPDPMAVRERELAAGGPLVFPAASVTAIEAQT